MRMIPAATAVACVVLCAGCARPTDGPGDVATTAAAPVAAPAAGTRNDTAAQWARSCALCHVNGEGGAPRSGDAEAWQPRLAKGRDVLMTHTLEGFNNMPPLGYCMSCERDDFAALIDLMAGAGS